MATRQSAMWKIVFSQVSRKQAQTCLTQRAPDKWESARFLAFFLASSFSRFQTESHPTHQRVTRAVGQLKGDQVNKVFLISLFLSIFLCSHSRCLSHSSDRSSMAEELSLFARPSSLSKGPSETSVAVSALE